MSEQAIKEGPPGNMNAFKHGLAAIQKRREESIITEHEESVRQQILDGLIADKGGTQNVSTATRILAEVIASDASWLMVFNGAIFPFNIAKLSQSLPERLDKIRCSR
jgi:hypothetical protein